jgi:hypothetical protein
MHRLLSILCCTVAVFAVIGCSKQDARGVAVSSQTQPPAAATPQETSLPASFALEVEKSDVLPVGKREFETQSAYAALTSELLGGKVNTVVIRFFPQSISDEAKARIFSDDPGNLDGAGKDTLFLFVGNSNEIYQANLTLEMPGATVTRTVARTLEEVAQKFATCHFDGQRLQLKSDGNFGDIAQTRA